MRLTPRWQIALPSLESETVLLRELAVSDATTLQATLTAPEVARYLTAGPSTVKDFEQFIAWTARERESGKYLCFGVVPRGHDAAVGLFQIWPLEPTFNTAEWGFAIGSAFWGTGLFVECAKLVLAFAVEQVGIRRLEARAAVNNGRGNGALRKMGAVREGVLRECFSCQGEFMDHVMWSILEKDWRQWKAGSS